MQEKQFPRPCVFHAEIHFLVAKEHLSPSIDWLLQYLSLWHLFVLLKEMLSQGAHTQPGTNRSVPTFLTMMVYLAVQREAVFSWLGRLPIFSWKRGNRVIPWRIVDLSCLISPPDLNSSKTKYLKSSSGQQGVFVHCCGRLWSVISASSVVQTRHSGLK